MSGIETIMRTSAVIPVLVIDDVATARPLAEALVAGGLRVLEVTMRTPAALDAIREMKQVAGAIVGAGTVVNTEQFEQVMDAGAEFIVSPGLTERLGAPIVDSGVPYLPGIANAGDIMRGLDLGLTHFKFFPAEAIGRDQGAEGAGRPVLPVQILPDRQHHRSDRAGLARVRTGAVRRRQLGIGRIDDRGRNQGAGCGGVAALTHSAATGV